LKIAFTISPSGKLIDVNPLNSLDPVFDLEVVKVIRSSRPWIVGKNVDGTAVHVRAQSIVFDKKRKN
jgi:hypothetical protein